MGFMDDAKETAKAVGEKIQDAWEDTTDRVDAARGADPPSPGARCVRRVRRSRRCARRR